MDKGKNRTTLLAAGRKKLQQFRQKKDNKGSNNKSSSKGAKSGRDTASGAANETTAAQTNNSEGLRSILDEVDTTALSSSSSRRDSAASDADYSTDASSGIANNSIQTASPTVTVEFASESSGTDKVDNVRLNEKADDRHDIDSGVQQKDGSSSSVAEDEKHNVPGTSDPIVLREESDSTLPPDIGFSSQPDQHHGVEQVTDLGAMQEVSSSSWNQIDQGRMTESEGHDNPSDDFSGRAGDHIKGDLGNGEANEATHAVAPHAKHDDASINVAITDAEEGQGSSSSQSVLTCPPGEPVTGPAVMSDTTAQQRKKMLYGLSNEEDKGVLNVSGGFSYGPGEGTQLSIGIIDENKCTDFKADDVGEPLGCMLLDLSPGLEGTSVKLSHLAEVVKLLDDVEFKYLFMSRESLGVNSRATDQMKDINYVDHDAFERLKEELYVTTFLKDVSHMELSEHKILIDEITMTSASLDEIQSKNYMLTEEIAKLRYELQEVLSSREELNKQLHFSKDEIEVLSSEVKELQNKLEMTKGDMSSLSSELVDCRNLVETLQSENESLNERFKSMTEEHNKHLDVNENLLLENEKVKSELAQCKASLDKLQKQETCSKAVADLKEATFHINQLAEENESLKRHLGNAGPEQLSHEEASAHPSGKSEVLIAQDPESVISSLDQQNLDIYDDSSGFVALKKHLEVAKTIVQKLEKPIEGMHSISLSRPSNKATAPEVSKLIQAFESKSNTDDHDSEEPTILTSDLEALLMDIVMDAGKASEFCKGVKQSKLLADAARTELRDKYDALREHSDLLEESSIELIVLYEALRENICQAVSREGELRFLCDATLKQEQILKSENSQLRGKLNGFQVKISELQSHLETKCRDSEEMVASVSNQVKNLEMVVAERESILQEEWNSVISHVLQTVGELDAAVENVRMNSTTSTGGNLDVVTRVASSICSAVKVIEDLHKQHETAQIDHQVLSDASDDMQERIRDLQVKNEKTSDTLCTLYNDLNEVVSETLRHSSNKTANILVDEKVLDPLHPNVFNTLLDQLKLFLSEKLHLESANKQLNTELMNSARHIDELEKQCLRSDTIMKLVDDIEHSLTKDDIEIHTSEPAPRLESLIYLLLEKYKKAVQGSTLSTSLEMHLSDLCGQMEHLNFMLLQCENENVVFKHSLKSAKEDVVSLDIKLQEKVVELEQSEQRVASLREKLSIAVTKGKGLISQRDSLKQSLAETSSELEKCSQELLSKDACLHELESKLEVYAEAGERMEALESELSYIRNSATALRESFLLKDSIIQRIEEILEDLELPEQFRPGDIIEKIDWLAKSAMGNSLPPNEWNLRNSEVGFVGDDSVKEEMMPNPNTVEDVRRSYEELQSKFYELAEQNEMLEQSLMERNNQVQRWEEILERVPMPSSMRSLEPEDKIQWLEGALSEAQNQHGSLQQKIDNLEQFCGSLTADTEDSQRRISELESAVHQASMEKENISRDLEILSHDNDEYSKKTTDLQIRNENLQNEVNMLQEQKLRIEEDVKHTEGAVRRMQQLVMDSLQNSFSEDVVFYRDGIDILEETLRNLVEKNKSFSSQKPVDIDPVDVHVTEQGEPPHMPRDAEEQKVAALSKMLDETMGELVYLKEEKDRYLLNNQSLQHEVETLGLKINELQQLLNQEKEEKDRYLLNNQSLQHEVEALDLKKNEFQQLLNQEEQKTSSLRDKLNVAVRKGKSLVQSRDGMKQVIEELNVEVERLKSETKHREQAISEYEQRIKDLSSFQESVQVMESEIMLLRDRLAGNERCLQDKEDSWKSLMDALGNIGTGVALNSGDPAEMLKELGKYLHELQTSLDSAEVESKKSKRAAELLLAELNEVQERNDGFQEELAKASHELSEVYREKALAETARDEALQRVEQLSIRSQENNRNLSEFMVLKSGMDQTREDLLVTERDLGDVLSRDLEVLHNVKVMMKSFLESRDTPDLRDLFSRGFPGGVPSTKLDNKVFSTEISSLRERLYNHSRLLHEETCLLSEVVRNAHTEYTSWKESFESMKRDFRWLESIVKEKDSELNNLRGNISLLYQTCSSTVLEIEYWKNSLVGNALDFESPEGYSKAQMSVDKENSFTNDLHMLTEEKVRGMHDKLFSVMTDFKSIQRELIEDGHKEMKSTLLNLQKELQEKDIQRDRICMELVNQIKAAETNANNHLNDLQQARAAIHDLQSQVAIMKEEREVLEQREKELKIQETNSIDLQQKVNSLTDAFAAKEQETEAFMQALDEQEAQIEELVNKISTLENEMQQKNQEAQNLETSRAKVLKKLSVTVNKFDELHCLSESLLSEVEKLQSQLQEQDGEISFLRQEVTRSTNNALAVTQISKNSSNELRDLLAWLDSLISGAQVHDMTFNTAESNQSNDYKARLQNQIMALVSELENLRSVSLNSETILQQERSKVEELSEKERVLKNSLNEKESQIQMLQDAGDLKKPASSTSDIVEVDQRKNSWAPPATTAQQVRSLRKTNNDQVAIAIDMDQSRDMLDEDDDKAHGFKSLTTSKIVPRFTRPISDMVDGLWVSCDRALMRQPALRLGVIIYWAIVHALLASFVV